MLESRHRELRLSSPLSRDRLLAAIFDPTSWPGRVWGCMRKFPMFTFRRERIDAFRSEVPRVGGLGSQQNPWVASEEPANKLAEKSGQYAQGNDELPLREYHHENADTEKIATRRPTAKTWLRECHRQLGGRLCMVVRRT